MLLVVACDQDPPSEMAPTSTFEVRRSECERPSVRIHIDVMNCELLRQRGVAERLGEDIAPRLESLFDTATVINPCDDTCGITLDLHVETVTWCEQEVSRQKFLDGNLLTRHVAKLRAHDPAVRHVVWGVDLVTEDGDRPSGYANGLDVIVAIGGIYRRDGLGPQQYAEPEAAVLMHELGHTLGLSHGDPECSAQAIESRHCTRLPHHLSVMNYAWLARGVGYGADGKEPEAWAPTYQGFETVSLRERQGTLVKLDPESRRCPVGIPSEPALQPWVAFYPNGAERPPRRVPIATPLRIGNIADGVGVDFNGDGRKDQRYRGQPNEWEWIANRRALEFFSVDLLHRVKTLWAPLVERETGTSVSDLEEPSVDALLDDLESSFAEPKPGVPK